MPNYTNYTADERRKKMPRYIEIPILIVLIIITGYFYIKERKKSYNAAKQLDEEAKLQKMQNDDKEVSNLLLTVKINGMMCEKCAERVMNALGKYGNVTVNLEQKSAVIECDVLPDTEEIKNTVNELGYECIGIE